MLWRAELCISKAQGDTLVSANNLLAAPVTSHVSTVTRLLTPACIVIAAETQCRTAADEVHSVLHTMS